MTTTSEPAMSERRAAQRKRTILGAQAVFNNGHSTIDCVVKNLSDAGALLALPEPTSLPEAFDLKVVGRDAALPSKVVRRTLKGVSVAFGS